MISLPCRSSPVEKTNEILSESSFATSPIIWPTDSNEIFIGHLQSFIEQLNNENRQFKNQIEQYQERESQYEIYKKHHENEKQEIKRQFNRIFQQLFEETNQVRINPSQSIPFVTSLKQHCMSSTRHL